MISLNSARSASEYLIEGPVCSFMGVVSNTDFVNSGSYLTAVLVIIFGITTFEGLGGSFLTTGFAVCLIETNDCGSFGSFFAFTGTGAGVGAATGTGFAAGAATFAVVAGFGAGLGATTGAGFFETTTAAFLGAGLETAPPVGRAGFFTSAFLGAAFTAFLGVGFPPAGRAGLTTVFLAAGFAAPPAGRAGFFWSRLTLLRGRF